MFLDESENQQEVVQVIEKRDYYHSGDSQEKPKETFLVIPEDNRDDWEEVKASKLSNPNNKIGFVDGYLVPKDTRKKRGATGGLLNLSKPESLRSFDQVQTEPTVNLVQPLVSYYDSFPGVKNYETEIVVESEKEVPVKSETDEGTDIIITEKKSVEPMRTELMRGYTYENFKPKPKLFHQKIGGYVYQSVKKTNEVEKNHSPRSFDSEDYYFYKNEYYRRPTEKEVDLRNEPIKSFLYEGRKKEIQLKSHRMINYTYQGTMQQDVDWEVEKRRLKRECKCPNNSGKGLQPQEQSEQHEDLFGLQEPRRRWT